MVHAESKALTEAATQRLVDVGNVGMEYYPESRPTISESEAIVRVIHLSQAAGSKLYFAHISAREPLEAVHLAQRSGQPVWGETTSAYLSLTDEVYHTSGAARYRVLPPIRGQKHQDALWEGMRDGVIHTVGSDHCGFHVSQKVSEKNDFRSVPPGLVGIETHPIVVFSEGVSKGRISLEKFVEVASTNPARIFGLYPKKGVIAPGSDADLCIIDPAVTWVLTPDALHFEWGWSPQEGMEIIGKTTLVIAGGDVIVENGEFMGERGRGRFLPRDGGRPPLA
jgi:dihydropyrimidinase